MMCSDVLLNDCFSNFPRQALGISELKAASMPADPHDVLCTVLLVKAE